MRRFAHNKRLKKSYTVLTVCALGLSHHFGKNEHQWSSVDRARLHWSSGCGVDWHTYPMVAKMHPAALAADTDTDEEDGAGGLEGSNKHTPRIRKPWHDTEDATLRALVNVLGVGRWADLARQMVPPDRTGKQCRERWHNHLSPSVDKNEWREEEDRAIAEGVARMGPKCTPLLQRNPLQNCSLARCSPRALSGAQGVRSSSCSLAAPTMRSRTDGTLTSARSSGGRHVKRGAKTSRASASTPRRGGRQACCRRGILQRRARFCRLPPPPRAPLSRPCCRSSRPRRTTTDGRRRCRSSALPLQLASRLRIYCSSPAVVRCRLPAQRAAQQAAPQRVAPPVPRARRIACRWPRCRHRSSAVPARARPIGSTRPPRRSVCSGTGAAGARRCH